VDRLIRPVYMQPANPPNLGNRGPAPRLF
jgi:hypothetical protein